jgi:hypothetical protein
MKSRKPALTSPSTPSTRATMASGRWRENSATASVHSDSIIAHSSSEPSCPPQTPAILYMQRQQLCSSAGRREHREIVLDEGPGQAAEANRMSSSPCAAAGRARQGAMLPVAVRADERQCALHQRHAPARG